MTDTSEAVGPSSWHHTLHLQADFATFTVDRMRRSAIRRVYLDVRRWTDAELTREPRGGLGLAPMVLAIGIGLLFQAATTGPVRSAAWAVCVAAATLWIGFISWRGIRLIKAASLLGDRDYDRHGRFLLPPEYAGSESHLSHRRRLKRARRAP